MPPKSAKKDQKPLWHECDKCKVKIIQSKLKSHENYCGKFSIGIFDEKLKINSINPSLPSEIDLKDAPTTFLQRFLFVPESICSFCNFTMGCNLLIQNGENKFVRSSWTVADRHLDEVFICSDGELMK
jgi:hypothetical protein